MFFAKIVMPPLALQIVAVQNAIPLQLAGPVLSALPQHGVHQRRLAMVDVGNNRNVSNVVTSHFLSFFSVKLNLIIELRSSL